MDNYNFHVEELEDVTEGRKRRKWVVKVIDLEGFVREEYLTEHDVWRMREERFILEIGPHNQLEGDSLSIFGMWFGFYSQKFCKDSFCFEDWRKIVQWKKDDFWLDIKKKFYFDASNEKFKKSVMKSLSQKWKAYKIRVMKRYRRETPEETIKNRPFNISEEDWSAFVHLQFSDEKKISLGKLFKLLQKGKRHRPKEPVREASSLEKMDNNNFHVEEPKDVTQGRKLGKWLVKVIDLEGNAREEHFTCQDIWKMHPDRVILEFGPHNQPEGESGGLFGTWLGDYSIGFCTDFLCYEDWRKIEKGKKDAAWEAIKKRFYFDASNEKYKKFVMKSLSQKCKDYKIRLMKRYRRETLDETIKKCPDFIPVKDWSSFVHLQFSDEKKKVRERNVKSRSYYKTPHTLGSKSIARKSKEILLQEKKRPSRAEMFVLSRKSQKSDKDFVSEEARDFSEKLIEKMTQNTGNTSENNITSHTNDVFAQVFGAERPGRVRCAGLGPTPSTFFQNDTASTSTETEVTDLRNRVTYLENKLERLDELEALIATMKGTNG